MTLFDLLPWLLLPVALGALRPGVRGPRPGWADLPLSLLAATAVALVAGLWLARFQLTGGGYVQSDFSQYCEVVDAARRGVREVENPHRSWLVGLALAPLAERLGVRDGMLAGALLSTVGTGVGVYLWGLGAAGRAGALASVLGFGVFGPLVLLPRTLGFTPELCAVLALLSGTTAMALRTRRLPWILAGGLALSLAPLVDLKALPWLVSALPLLLLAALVPPPVAPPAPGAAPDGAPLSGSPLPSSPILPLLPRLLGRVALVLTLLAGSWRLGPAVWPPAMGGTLESQVASYVAEVEVRAGRDTGLAAKVRSPGLCGYHPTMGFRWGTGDPRDIPRTLSCLAKMRAAIPPEDLATRDLAWMRTAQVTPLVGPLVGAGLVGLVGLAAHTLRRRSAWRLVAWLGPMPAWVYGFAAAAAEDGEPRRLATALVFAPVVLGVAWAVLFRWRSARPSEGPAPAWRLALVSGLALVALVLLVLGVVPSGLGPQARWRVRILADQSWSGVLHGSVARAPTDPACAAAHAADLARGVPERSVFAGWYGER